MAESPRVVVGGVEVSVDHLIGGERLASAHTFECRSSLDWQHKLADVSRGDEATAHQAVSAAVDGFAAWGGLPVSERAAALRRLADLIEARNDDIALVETLDMGFLHRSMRERLVARGALNFRFYADMVEAHDEPRWPARGTAHTVQRMPAGPAVVITPWNAPFMLATWKVAPALAAGNSVVLKPAEWSPLSASLLADLTVEAGLPPGAFNLVQGIGAEVGAALTADPRVRRISFTGSPETARHIGAAAAANIVPFTAELGGKGPLIVFADCDLEAAADQAAAQYEDSGQVCLAGTRLLVEASILDDFLEALRVRTEAHVLGDSRNGSTTIAPMVHPDHLARVEGFVERARAAGDTVVWGGRRRAGSLHYELTLIEPASNDSEIVQREVFGPVLTIQAFSTEAEAVARPTPPAPVGHRLHGLSRASRAGRRRGAGRDRVDQHLPGGPGRPLRRLRPVRNRPRGRRPRPRFPQRPEDPHPRGLGVTPT